MNDESHNREYKRQLNRDERFERSVVAFQFQQDLFAAALTPKGGPKQGGPKTKGGPKQGGPKADGINLRPVSPVEFRIQIAEFIAAHPDTTTRDIAMRFGSARSAIMKHLAHLKAADVVWFVGTPRNGHWEVRRECTAELESSQRAESGAESGAESRAESGAESGAESRAESGAESRAESGAESRAESRAESDISALERKILGRFGSLSASKGDIAIWLGKASPDGQLNRTIGRLLAVGLIERTIPDKPNSRLQKYRLTNKGLDYMRKGGE